MIKDPSVVIIGSGPGGFYVAEAITKKLNSDIDIIDRLPTPFGLIRSGVAPDHQNTKKIIARYTNTAKKEQIRFFGNIEIGRDFSIEELRNIYDVVILATGLELDKKLEIKGSDLKVNTVRGNAALGEGKITSISFKKYISDRHAPLASRIKGDIDIKYDYDETKEIILKRLEAYEVSS